MNDSGGSTELVGGGPCRYDAFRGIVVITSIRPEADRNSHYDDGARLLFDFEPAFPWRPCDFRIDTWPTTEVRYTVNGGLDPSMRWIRAEGITVGDEHRAIRQDIVEGTCAPVVYRIPALDNSWRQWQKTGPRQEAGPNQERNSRLA